MGNILERGVGMGRLGDHFGNVIGMEIVLPSGELLRTGILRVAASSSGIDTTQIAPYSWGVGPYLDGIFSQSNFGICTALALRLDPIQEAAEACYCLSPDEDALAAIVEVVRELSFAGVLSGSANIISRNRVIAARMQYPWQETNGKTPLSKDLSRCLGTRFAIPAWTTMLFLEGKCGLVRAQKRELKRSLSNITSEQRFFSERSIRRLEQLDTLLKKLHLPGLKKVASIRSTFDLMKGVPNEMSLRAPYWRNRSVPLPAKDFDPLRDGCGLLWIAPVLPAIGKTVAAFDTWLEAFLNRFGFDNAPNYLSMQQGRTIISTIPLLYDKGTKVECERAESCYHELIAACISHGFPPYRLGVQSLPEFIDKNDPYWKIIDDLKQSLDPDGVLAEGHYAPRGNHLN